MTANEFAGRPSRTSFLPAGPRRTPSVPPAGTSWGPGRLDVFAIGAGGALMHSGYDATGWRSWRSLGGRIASDPTAVSWAPGRIDVFATASDASLWHTWLN